MPKSDEAYDLAQLGTPASPASGRNKVYFKSDGKLYILDSSGAESALLAVSAPLAVHVGYRSGTSDETLTHGNFTTVSLAGTADHDVGSGFSKASDTVTITNAGVYRLHAEALFNVATGNCRNILRIETWTGSDPGVGSATAIATAEELGNTVNFNSLNCETQRTFAAGAKVRLIAYQNQGSSNTLKHSLAVSQLNIIRLS